MPWLADAYSILGGIADAYAAVIGNDVGLLAEEYDTVRGRLVGNFPQGISHVGARGPAKQRSERQANRNVASGEERAAGSRRSPAA